MRQAMPFVREAGTGPGLVCAAAAQGIAAAAGDAAAAIDAGNHAAAAERFIDYWMGAGTWEGWPEARRGPVAQSMVNVRGWATALFDDPRRLADFRALELPVLCMLGGQSPPSSRGVARLLTRALPRVTLLEFAELGHMGPVTHAERVNEAVAAFLARH